MIRVLKQTFTATIAMFLLCEGHAANPPAAAKAPSESVAADAGSVQVVDALGRPVSGVSVMLQHKPEVFHPDSLEETSVTVSDLSGRFQPPPPESPETYVVLRKSGLESLAVESNRRFPERVTMRAGRVLNGQILDPAGKPVSNAMIGPVVHPPTMRCLDHWEHRNPLPRQFVAVGQDGAFKLSALPLEPFAFQVTAPGFTPRLVTVPAGEISIKVGMETGGAIISGNVIGSKDRAPQPNIAVEAAGNGISLFSYTDSQGTYAFDNVPTGTWAMRPTGGGPRSGTQSRYVVMDIEKKDEIKDVPLVLNQGILLAGRAIDAETSEGLSKINITLAGYGGRGAKAVFTEPDGSFVFENLDSLQDVFLRFDPVKYVYVMPGGATRDYYDINQAGDTNFDLTTITLPLHKRVAVRGKVTDASGQPAPDVEVRLQSRDVISSAPSKSGPGPLEFSAFTNAKGEFITGVYPAGRYKVWGQQEAMVSPIQQINAYTTSPVAALDLRMSQAAQVTGMVVDSNDRIVTGAIVIAFPADSKAPEEDPIPGRESYAYAKSNLKGEFTLKGLRGEPMIMRATHSNYLQEASMPLDPAKAVFMSSDSLRLKFPTGGELYVAVTDDTGQPLSRAEVRIEYNVGLDGNVNTVNTDQYGRAYIGSIPTTVLNKITVSHPVFSPYIMEDKTNLPVADLRVSLKKRGSLIAQVDGLPANNSSPVEIYLLSSTIPANMNPPANSFVQSTKSGVITGQASFANLTPGWYKAAYSNGGVYAETEATYIDAGSGDHIVKLTIPQGIHLVGFVKDKNSGAGVPGANVTLRPAIDNDFVVQQAQQNTISGDGGQFELYNVGSSKLHIRVIAANYPDYEKEMDLGPNGSLEILLSNDPGALKGRVTAGDAPVEGALVVLSTMSSSAGPVASGVTDASGNYTLENFPAGTYTLSVEAPIGEGENISRKTLNVEIADQSATKDIAFKSLVKVSGTARLQGKSISRESGQPVSLLFRAKDSGDSKMVNLEEGGRYSVQLEPGSYIVGLEDREGTPIEIPSGSQANIDLNF